jgi:hypothetical protein
MLVLKETLVSANSRFACSELGVNIAAAVLRVETAAPVTHETQ